MSEISYNDYIQLRNRIKQDIARRTLSDTNTFYNVYNMDLAGNDYSVEPARGKPVLLEHIQKIITPINGINSDLGAEIGSVNVISSSQLQIISEIITTFENDQPQGASSCKTNCIGLCSTACSGSCKGGCGDGCTSCSGSCKGGCGDGCTSCTGSCKGGCTGGCYGSCSTACGSSCGSGARYN